jgi:hypothetical protein
MMDYCLSTTSFTITCYTYTIVEKVQEEEKVKVEVKPEEEKNTYFNWTSRSMRNLIELRHSDKFRSYFFSEDEKSAMSNNQKATVWVKILIEMKKLEPENGELLSVFKLKDKYFRLLKLYKRHQLSLEPALHMYVF